MSEPIATPPQAIIHVGRVLGSPVLDPSGEKLGSITELMVDTARGSIVYAVLTRGGILGVGEKLYAVPFDRLVIDAESGEFRSSLTGAQLDLLPGFDKDAWPTRPDPELAA